ncbi:hypothetical protein IV203_012554 [Nitzschia inconspicua]|uniref:Uncharacterized protein n=1 Tax=Nitzschia inconspicua TaxID=303405 RepID=A0A9K3KUQ0_9STRA|nr:hypothetical protein IV203_012554 [Nitzschia inconspicua]
MDQMNYVPYDKRGGSIKEALSVYINEKKSDKTVFDTVDSTEMISRNRLVVAPESGENDIDDDGTVDFHKTVTKRIVPRKEFQQKDGVGTPINATPFTTATKEVTPLLEQVFFFKNGNPKKFQTNMLSKTSKALDDLTQSSVDVLQASHTNVADAFDSCGPCISLKRTWVSVGGHQILDNLILREPFAIGLAVVKIHILSSTRKEAKNIVAPSGASLFWTRAANDDAFVKFQSLLDPKMNVKEYAGGWLINDVHDLAVPITEKDIEKMKMALEGRLEDHVSLQDDSKTCVMFFWPGPNDSIT